MKVHELMSHLETKCHPNAEVVIQLNSNGEVLWETAIRDKPVLASDLLVIEATDWRRRVDDN